MAVNGFDIIIHDVLKRTLSLFHWSSIGVRNVESVPTNRDHRQETKNASRKTEHRSSQQRNRRDHGKVMEKKNRAPRTSIKMKRLKYDLKIHRMHVYE